MANHHVQIACLTTLFELTERISFPPISALDQSVFFNPFHVKPHLLLLQKTRVEIISLESGISISSWRFPVSGYIRQIKLSLDFLYLGVLRTAKNLEIRTLYNEDPVFVITRDEKKSDSILGFEWVYHGEMILISSDGVQFYNIETNSAKCTKSKSIKTRMNWYQYWPDTKLLIVSTGTCNLFIYRILPKSNYEIYPTLQLNLPQVRTARGIEPLPVQVTRLHVHLFSFHGHNYVGFLNNWIGTPTLSLYRVTSRTCYRKDYELQLGQPGSFIMNTVDNLLITHNTTTKETLIFDIKSPFPSQPLLQPTSELFDFLVSKRDHDTNGIGTIDTDWCTTSPNFIVSPSSGRVFALQVNLAQVLEYLGQRADLTMLQVTEFVIRRKSISAFPLRTRPIRKAIMMEADVTVLRPMYDTLYLHYDLERTTGEMKRTSSYESSISELSSRFSSSASLRHPPIDREEYGVPFQEDMFCHVFSPVMTKRVKKYHSFCLLEFIESQRAFGQSIKPFVYDLLVHVLVETGSHTQLYQLIQFGIIPDSLTMATLLTTTSVPDSVPFKYGIEMFKRMECHHDVLQLLTTTNHLLDAISYALQTNTIKMLKPAPFLESALQIDKTLFLNIYRCFEEHGLIPMTAQLDHQYLPASWDGIHRYISIYREIWGPKIDMESFEYI